MVWFVNKLISEILSDSILILHKITNNFPFDYEQYRGFSENKINLLKKLIKFKNIRSYLTNLC